jgi:methionine-rich copper-binding protein CopC
VTFSEAIQRGSGTIYLRSGSATGTVIESFNAANSNRLSISGTTLTIDPTNDLANNIHYYLTFASGTVKDLAGNSYVGTSSYDFTTVADTTAPTVTSFSPSDGTTDVALGSNIVLTFNEAIKRGTGTIYLCSDSATGTVIESFNAANSNRLSISGTTLTIDPTNNLANNTHYYLTFASGTIKDVAGNSYAGTSSYDFTTVPDTTAPTVSTFTPRDGATGIAVGNNIILTFSEAIQRGTGMIYLRSGSETGTVIESFDAASSNRLSISGSTLTIDPSSDLANNTHYFITFASATVKDLAGNNYAGTSSYDFTTIADTVAPIVALFSPSDGTTSVALGSNIVLTFNEAIQRGTGTIYLRSGSATGTVIESYLVTNSSNLSINGNTLTLNPSNDLANNSHYYVTFTSGTIKDLAGNSYAGTSSYDFTTPDTLAPTVTTFSPSDGTTGVAVASNIVLTFSEAIQRGTGTIYLRSDSATGTIIESFDAATSNCLSISSTKLTINPTNNLANNTHYYLTFGSGTTKDLAGNNYAGTTSYDFTTALDTTAPTISSFSPSDGVTGVDASSNIVVTFSEAIQRGTGGYK